MKLITSLIITCTVPFMLNASWQDLLNKGKELLQESTQNKKSTSLSENYKIKALQEALNIGVAQAIESLSGEGFLNHKTLKIPMPQSLEKVTKLIIKFGGKQYVEDFEKTLNLAAGKAMPKTASIFADTISKMSINDATSILNGKDDAATTYFKDKTLSKLQETIEPLVKDSTSQSRLTSSYKNMINFYKQNKNSMPNSDLLSQVSSTAKTFGFGDFLPMSEEDLDTYITRKSIDGMFYLIGEEEKKIRQHPLNYGSSVIQKVFGK